MKLGLEIVGLLLGGLIASRVVRRTRQGTSSTSAAFAVVAAVAVACACSGIVVSTERGVRAFRDGAALSAEGRLVPAGTEVTIRLRKLGLTSAVALRAGAPTWIRFAEWLRTSIPPQARFAISSPTIAASSQFRAWIDWRLLPRVQVASSDTAHWIVFFDRNPPTRLASADVVFARGYSLARTPSHG